MSLDALLVGRFAIGSGSSGTTASGTTSASGSTFAFLLIYGPTGSGAADPSGNPTDNKGNTYTPKGSTFTSTNGDLAYKWYVSENGAGGAGHTASINFVNASALATGILLEITSTGNFAATDLVVGDGTQSAPGPLSIATGTLGDPNEVIVCGATSDTGASSGSGTITSSNLTVLDSLTISGSLWNHGVGKIIQSGSTASVSPNWTIDSGGLSHQAAISAITFKASAGGGGATQLEDTLHRPALMPVFRPTAAPQVIRPGTAALFPTVSGPTAPAGAISSQTQALACLRPPVKPQVIQCGIAALLPLVIGPTIPAGSTAPTQALEAYRAPTHLAAQPQAARITQPGIASSPPPAITPQIPPVPWAHGQLEQWRLSPKPAPFGGIAAITLRYTPPQHPPAQPWPYSALQRFATTPIAGAAAAAGTPSAPPVSQLTPAAWPYVSTMLPAPTASMWGIPDADLVFDRLWPPIVQPSTWPYAAMQRAPVVPIASPVVGAVLPSSVLLPQGRDWPWAATMLPATPQAALLASIAYSIGPQAVPVPGVQPWPYAAMQPARAVPLIAADFVLPSVTLMPQVQPWPYASTMLPEPASAFFGITAVYGGAVPVLMGRALPFPYASTMLPVPTSSMWGLAASAVFPLPGQVLTGVIYGPNGNDYTGTLAASSGGVYLRRR